MLLYNYMKETDVKVKKNRDTNILKEKISALNSELCAKCHTIKLETFLEKLSYQNEEEKELTEDMLKSLEKILRDKINYYDDLYSAIFLAYLHNSPESDSFSLKMANVFMDEEKHSEEYRILKKFESQKSEIDSVWNSNDKKFDKNDIRCNYLDFFDAEEDNDRIISIPGGCFLYHSTLISKEHMGLFDLEKNTEDYKRYGFGKSHMFYENLKYGPVENRLLMEYTLGIGYLNQIYPYIKLFNRKDEIEKLRDNVLEMSVKDIPFFLRGKITSIIWEYIIWNDFSEERIENVGKVLSCVKEDIRKIYQDTLKQWWEVFWEYADKDDWHMIEVRLQQEWEAFFKEDTVYRDWIMELKICDWREVESVEDCFTVVESFRKPDKYYTGKKLTIFELSQLRREEIIDRTGRVVILLLESPTNKIGEKVLETTIKCLSKKRFPVEISDLYRLYYDIRKEEFDRLKKSEKAEFTKKEIKIKESGQKLKPEQVYAWLHKYVM